MLTATGTAVAYVVPSLTRYEWRSASVVVGTSGLVLAGNQANGQANYVCRAIDRFNVVRAGKSDGSTTCWVWDGAETGRSKTFGYEYLMFV